MKKFLAAALSVCVMAVFGALAVPKTLAEDPLPAAMTDVAGLTGYKAFVYQDFSAEGLSMWVSDAGNKYSISDGRLAITGWAAWKQGKVNQAGQAISDEVYAAAEGYGFYIKQTASQWVRPLYYIQSGNQVVTPPGETEYILVPSDGSAPTTAKMRASGDFLLSGAFEGYVLVKLPLSGLTGFSPFAMVGGNLSASDAAPIYFDNFLVWATAPAPEPSASPTSTAGANTTSAATTAPAATSATATPSAGPDLSDMVKLKGLKGYRAFVYQDFSASDLSIWQSDDYNQYSITGGQLSVSKASGGAWTQAKIEQAGKSISEDIYNAAQGYGFYIKNNSSGQWIRPYYYVKEGNKVITPAGESEYILVPSDGSPATEGVMRASGDFLLPAGFEGYVLVKAPLNTLEGFSPYAFLGGNLRADGEFGTVYFDNFMVWMADKDGSGNGGDFGIVLFAAAGAIALGALTVIGVKKRAHK